MRRDATSTSCTVPLALTEWAHPARGPRAPHHTMEAFVVQRGDKRAANPFALSLAEVEETDRKCRSSAGQLLVARVCGLPAKQNPLYRPPTALEHAKEAMARFGAECAEDYMFRPGCGGGIKPSLKRTMRSMARCRAYVNSRPLLPSAALPRTWMTSGQLVAAAAQSAAMQVGPAAGCGVPDQDEAGAGAASVSAAAGSSSSSAAAGASSSSSSTRTKRARADARPPAHRQRVVPDKETISIYWANFTDCSTGLSSAKVFKWLESTRNVTESVIGECHTERMDDRAARWEQQSQQCSRYPGMAAGPCCP